MKASPLRSGIEVINVPFQNLLDSRSLKFIVRLTLHDRTTKSLLHLHKKKKTPSISAQFQVTYYILNKGSPVLRGRLYVCLF